MVPGTQLWQQFFSRANLSVTNAAFAPGGARVFVTGGWTPDNNVVTVAYNATTGARLWARHLQGAGAGAWVAVSPDGTRVFVASFQPAYAGDHYISSLKTVAYRAGTGAVLWTRRFVGFQPTALTVGPDGRRLYITGAKAGDYATVAYSTSSGVQQWFRRYNGPARRGDGALAIAASRDGRHVFVTGRSNGGRTKLDYATVAYSATTGAALWVRRYNGTANGNDAAYAITAAGGKTFVTGWSPGVGTRNDFVTLAYNSLTGNRLWARRYNGPGNSNDAGHILSPAGTKVFVTGRSLFSPNLTTVAYDTTTGRTLSVVRFILPAGSSAGGVAVSPASNRLVVGGTVGLGLRETISYNLTTGAQVWLQSYSREYADSAGVVIISPDRTRVLVTGDRHIFDPDASDGYVTIAYRM